MAKAVPGTRPAPRHHRGRPYGTTALYRVKDDPAAARRGRGQADGHARRRRRLRLRLPPEVRRERLRLRRLERQGRRARRRTSPASPATRWTASRPTPSTRSRRRLVIEWESERPQRRRRLLRPRRHALRHLRRRHVRLRHEPHGPADRHAAGQGAPHRRGPTRTPGKPYSVPKDNPFVGDKRFAPGDVGLRPAQPVADRLRREDRPRLGRQQRPGPVGAGLPRPQGRELRLERHGGRPPVLPEPHGRADADRRSRPSSTTTPSPARSPAASSTTARSSPTSRGAYIYGDYSTGRIWAHEARRHEAALAQGAGRHAACRSPASAPTRRASCSSATTAARRGRALHPGADADGRAAVHVPAEAQRERAVRLGEGPPHEAGRDAVLGERPVLVGRRCTRSGSSPCRPDGPIGYTAHARLELPGQDGRSSRASPSSRRGHPARGSGSRRGS